MKTAGLFFLTRRPARVRMSAPGDDEVMGWLLSVVERHSNRGVQHVVALWRDAEGTTFVETHADRLKAGCALRLELDRLHVADNEICGLIASCELAPDRWPARAEADTDRADGAEADPSFHQLRPMAA